ncbi:hypothetical protein BGZ73_001784 [Actinomortierella ambigua]|nr:hypothetical protein BGZ73_001784 [Actinomortierella ambigua]
MEEPIRGTFDTLTTKTSNENEDSDDEDMDDLDSVQKWLSLLSKDKTILEKATNYSSHGLDSTKHPVVKFKMRDLDFFNWLPGGKTQKQRYTIKATKKSMCNARLSLKLGPPGGEDGVRWADIEYRFMHNHPVGLGRDLASCFLSNAMKERIKADLKHGCTTDEIVLHSKHQRDKKIERMKLNNERVVLCRDDVVSRSDVDNIRKTLRDKEIVKGPTDVLSSIEWMKEFKKQDFMVYYDEQDTALARYFAFATTWQMDQLYSYGDMPITIDGVHQVYGDVGCGVPVAFLLTTTLEAPVLSGWLKSIQDTMRVRYSTKERPYELKPAAFYLAQGTTEISAAINTAFARLGIRLYYCSWRIHRVWVQEVSKRLSFKAGDSQEQRKQLKSQQLISIQKEKSKDKAFAMIDNFCKTWSGQRSVLDYLVENYFDTPSQAFDSTGATVVSTSVQAAAHVETSPESARGASVYSTRSTSATTTPQPADSTVDSDGSDSVNLDGSQSETDLLMEPDPDFDRFHDTSATSGQSDGPMPKETWMACFRQGLPTSSMDTSHLNEPWHHMLQRHFPKDKQKTRLDHVIHFLVSVAVPKFQEDCHPELANVGRACKTEALARQHRLTARTHLAERASKGYSDKCVIITTVLDSNNNSDKRKMGERSVESFQGPNFPRHTVRISYHKAKRGRMVSCTCPWFSQHRVYCKHMGLVHTYDDGVESDLLTSFTYGSYHYGIPDPPTATPKTQRSSANLGSPKCDMNSQPQTHLTDTETATETTPAEVVEYLKEIIAIVQEEPQGYILFQKEIRSMLSKMRLEHRKRPGQPISRNSRKRLRCRGEMDGGLSGQGEGEGGSEDDDNVEANEENYEDEDDEEVARQEYD